MKWVLVIFAPAALSVGGVDLGFTVSGAIMLAGFLGLVAELITVDQRAEDKALSIVYGEKYDPNKSNGSVLIPAVIAVAVVGFLSKGEGIDATGICLLAGAAVGFVLGVWLSPEPNENDVLERVEKIQREQAMKYMKELKRSDPAAYRHELARLKAAQLEQGGEIPPELEKDCEEMGIDGSEFQGSSLLRLL